MRPFPFSAQASARQRLVARLRRERTIEEYRKFCFLAVHAGHPVAPSDEVDQVWHQHLLYSRHYWEALCRDTLEMPLHHGPTEGGVAEGRKYHAWYETRSFPIGATSVSRRRICGPRRTNGSTSAMTSFAQSPRRRHARPRAAPARRDCVAAWRRRARDGSRARASGRRSRTTTGRRLLAGSRRRRAHHRDRGVGLAKHHPRAQAAQRHRRRGHRGRRLRVSAESLV